MLNAVEGKLSAIYTKTFGLKIERFFCQKSLSFFYFFFNHCVLINGIILNISVLISRYFLL